MNKLYNDTAVQAIANAIRAKNGSSDTYTIAEMSTALNDLSYYAKPTISNVALATFEADGLPLNSLKVSVEAKQDLHGYDKPWVGGAGKNKLIDSDYVQGVIGWDGTTADTIIENIHFITSPYIPINNNTAYTLSAIHGNIVRIYITDENHNTLYFSGNKPIEGNNVSVPAKSGAVYFRFSIGIDDEAIIPSDYGTKVYGQLELGSTATAYEPYSNICPISGWSEVNVSDVDDVDNPTVTQTTTISLGQTVYGGEVDVVNGILKITDGYIASYNGETLPSTWISSMDVYAEGTSPTTGAEVVYTLASSTTVSLTPTLIKSLEGTNNLSVDCGDVIELEYFKEV